MSQQVVIEFDDATVEAFKDVFSDAQIDFESEPTNDDFAAAIRYLLVEQSYLIEDEADVEDDDDADDESGDVEGTEDSEDSEDSGDVSSSSTETVTLKVVDNDDAPTAA